MVLIAEPRRQKPVGLCKFKARLVYIARSRSVRVS